MQRDKQTYERLKNWQGRRRSSRVFSATSPPPNNRMASTRSLPSRKFFALVTVLMLGTACERQAGVSAAERLAIADSLETLVRQAYDFSQPNPTDRLLSLYPDSGRVISATGGRVSSTRDSLATDIRSFWQNVGQNMKDPKFEIGSSYVDVITPDAVVMTFGYRIPHITPLGNPHLVAGVWTTFWRKQNGRWVIVQEHLSDTPQSSASTAHAADSSARHAMPGHR